MPMTRAIKLPVELWNNIIRHHRENKTTLQATAPVCQDFAAVSQRYLFSEVILSPPEFKARRDNCCARFQRLLHHAPHIASYVHRLKIVDGYHTLTPRPNADCYVNWIITSTTLSRVLRVLKSLKSLCITLSGRNRGALELGRLAWNSLSEDLRGALLSACQSIVSLSGTSVCTLS